MAKQIVGQPELGFLFPAFDNRSANLYNALYYLRKPEVSHPEFVEAVFRTELDVYKRQRSPSLYSGRHLRYRGGQR